MHCHPKEIADLADIFRDPYALPYHDPFHHLHAQLPLVCLRLLLRHFGSHLNRLFRAIRERLKFLELLIVHVQLLPELLLGLLPQPLLLLKQVKETLLLGVEVVAAVHSSLKVFTLLQLLLIHLLLGDVLHVQVVG